MAIKSAELPAEQRDGEVPVPSSIIQRDRWGRPLIPLQSDPGGEPVARTRSSGFGKYLEDGEGLKHWTAGIVAVGMGRQRSLQLEAAALGTQDPEDRATKAALRKLREHAFELGGGNDGWRRGTALHRLTEVIDEGADPGDQGEYNVVLDRYRELTAGFEIVCSEVFGANDRWLTAGTFDFLLRPCGHLAAPDGTVFGPADVIGGDKKTSGTSRYFGPKFAVQLTTYFTGEPIDKDTGAWTTWDVVGGRPDRRWALILHLPSDPRKVDESGWHWVSLADGERYCDLSAQIRAVQRERPIVPCPRFPTVAHPRDMRRAGALASIAAAGTPAAVRMAWRAHREVWTEELQAAAQARLVELELAEVSA